MASGYTTPLVMPPFITTSQSSVGLAYGSAGGAEVVVSLTGFCGGSGGWVMNRRQRSGSDGSARKLSVVIWPAPLSRAPPRIPRARLHHHPPSTTFFRPHSLASAPLRPPARGTLDRAPLEDLP